MKIKAKGSTHWPGEPRNGQGSRDYCVEELPGERTSNIISEQIQMKFLGLSAACVMQRAFCIVRSDEGRFLP